MTNKYEHQEYGSAILWRTISDDLIYLITSDAYEAAFDDWWSSIRSSLINIDDELEKAMVGYEDSALTWYFLLRIEEKLDKTLAALFADFQL